MTRTVGDKAKGGLYFNLRTWEVTHHRRTGDALRGDAGDRFLRIPTVTLLLLGPIMGLAFVIFLPLIGFGLVALELGRKVVGLFARRPALAPKAARR